MKGLITSLNLNIKKINIKNVYTTRTQPPKATKSKKKKIEDRKINNIDRQIEKIEIDREDRQKKTRIESQLLFIVVQ